MAETSLKRRVSGIEKLHAFLLASFSSELAYPCVIDVSPAFRASNPARSWRRSSGGKAIFFYLWGQDERASPVASLESGIPAVLLREEDGTATDRAWVSWVEKWQLAKKGDDFELLSVSFRFYWGRPFSIEEQLFRAEWDQPNENMERNRTERAAHPHWHIDWHVKSVQIMSGVHLGMGGWRQSGESPECWQSEATTDESLVEWAQKTLCYGRQQLRDYPLKYE